MRIYFQGKEPIHPSGTLSPLQGDLSSETGLQDLPLQVMVFEVLLTWQFVENLTGVLEPWSNHKSNRCELRVTGCAFNFSSGTYSSSYRFKLNVKPDINDISVFYVVGFTFKPYRSLFFGGLIGTGIHQIRI